MNDELKKSLTELIDQTLSELEELRKSRFQPAEVNLAGPGADGIAGKPANGDLAAKAEDEDETEEEETEEVEKAKCTDEEPHKDDPKHEEKEKDIAKKLLDMHKSNEEIDNLKKSVDGMETLMKSYIDEKLTPLQDTLATVLETVNKLANAPAPAKGVSYKDVAPLLKSNSATESLSKSQVASKLFELKKSGTFVETADIARAEMGHDLGEIIAKYDIQ